MRTSKRVRLGLGLSVAAFATLGARGASATTVLELGDNGSEQMGRGGAWVARASDPLATFYNPAGLAGQETRLTLQGNINIQSTCFTRVKAFNDATTLDGNLSPSNPTPTIAPGGTFPQVCNSYSPTPTSLLVPQLAFTYRVTPRLGIGFAVVTPSASPSSQNWPTTLDGGPAPQRYLLVSATPIIVTPTLGVGWEPIDHLRIGAAFVWGIANLDFVNASYLTNAGALSVPGSGLSTTTNDVRGEINVSQSFIPGFTAGAIWSPSDNLDVAGWYKFMSSIDASGSVKVTVPGPPVTVTDTSYANCYNPGGPSNCSADSVHVKVNIPMEAKLGIRYHQPRAGVAQAHRRDPMATDVFDLEADLTWANDSAFQNLDISLPVVPVNLPGGIPQKLPADASVMHDFQDVLGVRIGGDYNLLRDMLAIRAGGYYQTAAQSSQYQNIDFVGQWEAGLALGLTTRIRLGTTRALELMAGFGHTFVGTSTYDDPRASGVRALAGTACNGAVQVSGASNTTGSNGNCTDGVQQFRSEWAVNLGTITSSFNQINLGAAYRF